MSAILDLLEPRLSLPEVEHGGQPLTAFNVEVTTAAKDGIDGHVCVIPVLAPDSVEAINRAFELLFPDWDVKKPTSGMKVKVTAFGR